MGDPPAFYFKQSGVVPFRRQAGGGVEVLLITSRKGSHWIIPKGIVDKGLTPVESAAKEAWEEAGVRGTVGGRLLGSYQYAKWGGTCTVAVYAMEVHTVADSWLESFRERRWFSLATAIEQVHEKRLKKILGTFGRIVGEE
ncbi:MAG: NUDIX hydrolase [Magnetococcales bacterium]|nr:NUDIX hydrolase [Magnetococcales bacterium]